MNFNRHMNQFLMNFQGLPIFVRFFWIVRDNADNSREFIDTNLPEHTHNHTGTRRLTLSINEPSLGVVQLAL